MLIKVNANPVEVQTDSLADALVELGYTSPAIATALNGSFVSKAARAKTTLKSGDALEVLAPMQGG
ncbi:MAG: sulfur carrier protein ThiS [Pelagimonas sp.]|uniref:sulfur carrier protein ThiS n=1 Tax=Pelagimonas sp. TaxID=2073170 RepID=UPI003D6A9A7E